MAFALFADTKSSTSLVMVAKASRGEDTNIMLYTLRVLMDSVLCAYHPSMHHVCRTDIINRARAYTFECRRCHKLIKMYAFLRTEKRFCKTCNIQLDAEVAERDRQAKAKRREVCPNTTAPNLPDST